MGRSIDASVREVWRDRLGRYESSELTVTDFCEAEGVSQASFYQWRKKLGRRRRVASAGRRDETAASRSPAFVPVVPTTLAVVVTLGNGVRVELPSSDHELVARVIHAVAQAAGGE